MSDPKTVAQRTYRTIDRMLGADRPRPGRPITPGETPTAALPPLLRAVHPRAHGAHVRGVAGPPVALNQTMKAGLSEAADVLLVNKADRSGAPALMADLPVAALLSLTSVASPKNIGWEIPVLSAEAQSGVGIAELLADVRRHRAALEAAGALAARRRARRREELKTLLLDEVRQKVERALPGGQPARTLDAVVEGALDPYSAVQAILTVLRLESS